MLLCIVSSSEHNVTDVIVYYCRQSKGTKTVNESLNQLVCEALWLPVSLFPNRRDPRCAGCCDMQSGSFDLCPTVNIHTLRNAGCTALHGCFLPAQWRCHTGTRLKPWALLPILEPQEETGGGAHTHTQCALQVHSSGWLLHVTIMRAGRKAMTL